MTISEVLNHAPDIRYGEGAAFPPRNRGERRHGRLLDCDGAAEYLGTTPRHIRAMWESREIAAVKVGRLVRYDPADLDKYIERRRVEAVR